MSARPTPITDAAKFRSWRWDSHEMDYVPSEEAVPIEVSADLERQRDQLLAALNRFDVDGLELEGDEEIDITMTAEDLRILRAAIAKAKGSNHE